MPVAAVEPAKIRVVFAADYAKAVQVKRPALVVVADPDNWNDYNLRLFANLYLLTQGSEILLKISLQFEGEKDTGSFLARRHREAGPEIKAKDIGKPFVSLQREADSYSVIVRTLGFDAAIRGLRGLRDAVLGGIEENEEILKLIDTREFHTAATRTAPHYSALRRGGRHLRRTPVPEVRDAATSFEIRARVPSSSEACRLEFDFTPDPMFQDRCCILIGRNGVGKTQMLKAIVDGFLHGAGVKIEGQPTLHPNVDVRRVMVFSSVPTDPYRRSIAPWEGVDYEYHPLTADEQPLGAAFKLAIVDSLRDDGHAFGNPNRRSGRADLLEELLGKLGLWEKLYLPLKAGREGEFSVTKVDGGAYTPVSHSLNEYKRNLLLHALDHNRPAAVLGSTMNRRRLSSGEIAMANFIAQVVASIETGSLLLFDEPETHLHPNFVSEFMDILQALLHRTRSVAIIATHSAYIVREVPRQRVNIMQVRQPTIDADGEPEYVPQVVDVARPGMQTFGSNVDDISRFVFADGILSHRYQEVLAQWVNGAGREMDVDDVLREHGADLNSETLSFIARAIRARGGD